MKQKMLTIIIIIAVLMVVVVGKFFTNAYWGGVISIILFIVIVGCAVAYIAGTVIHVSTISIPAQGILHTENVTEYLPWWYYFLIIPGSVMFSVGAYYLIKTGNVYNYVIAGILIFFVVITLLIIVNNIFFPKSSNFIFTNQKIFVQPEGYNKKTVEMEYGSIDHFTIKGNILSLQMMPPKSDTLLNTLDFFTPLPEGAFVNNYSFPIIMKVRNVSVVKKILEEHNVKQLTK
jgi:hypothetical protein